MAQVHNKGITAIILAAGKGKRMKSSLPKVMHALASKPMIQHVVSLVESLGISHIHVVVSPEGDAVAKTVAPYPTIIQHPAQGTGHAVDVAVKAIGSAHLQDIVLVLYGDTPLIYANTLRRMLQVMESDRKPAVVVLGFLAENPSGYGRLLVHGESLEGIIEEKDASDEQKAISLCNSGVMAIRSGQLPGLLAQLKNHNAQGEYYLTDIVQLAREQGLSCSYIECHEQEVQGINSRQQLALCESMIQQRLRLNAMDQGVTLIDPHSVTLAVDTNFGQDIIIEPHVFIGPKVSIANNVHIKAFSHIEGAHIGQGAVVGPFARLRPGAVLEDDVKIGNFVEVKQSTFHKGAKASHLSYVGDSTVGEGANIGAGTITCNYDGYNKHHTDIGAHAFIGSNTALVAPVIIGEGAIIGAGSTISRDVPKDSLSLTRSEQKIREGKANGIRNKLKAKKELKKESKVEN
ncbi:MAG: bifunctional UDP-N-acetylglucosamine diphosphorylase/glucosamine-1-phosphate N-acetyltransferase GlmU [Alphaproteobacteria bacterium]|nr:bifunctional UDP-N-acetylglucosamine diphosphorylase/glucosamine-1-phosphate N-acetyltransferase GlmU [Alphaproteobacteria bacterium]